MMFYSYSLTFAQARICRIAAALFLGVALVQAGALLLALAAPQAVLGGHCGSDGCRATVAVAPLLPDDVARRVAATPGGMARVAARLDARAPRLGLAVAVVAEQAPLAMVLFCAAIALRRFGARRQDDLARALPWLRRATAAALVAVIASPVALALRRSILLSAAEGGTTLALELDLRSLLLNLLLATVACIVTWALAAGHRAQRDLAEIV